MCHACFYRRCRVVLEVRIHRASLQLGLNVVTHASIHHFARLFCNSVWLFHPFSINISTRGNADSIVVLLVLLTLLLLMRKQLVLAALMYVAFISIAYASCVVWCCTV